VKPLAIRKESATAETLTGRVLCHDVRDAAGKIVGAKGAVVDAAAAAVLWALPWDELHVIAIDADDLHEEVAGRRLAAAVVGEGVEVKGYTGGQWALAAGRRGLVAVRDAALLAVNGHDGISVFTLYRGQPVEAGEVVGRAKVTPLVIAESTVRSVEAIARGAGGCLAVDAFRPATVGAVARETLEPRQRERFESALKRKLDWFGSRLLAVRFAGTSARAVADELQAVRADGASVLIVAGASALDPLDPVFGALTLVGARMERHGAPAHPGSLLWLARWGELPVLGMPTCGMFSQATTFDLVLPRLLTGEAIGARDIAALGHGGLLSRELAYRFPPYSASAARGELDADTGERGRR